MTIDEAYQFFADHGNVARDAAQLRAARPTLANISAAVDHAVRVRHQDPTVAAEAARIVAQATLTPSE